MVLGVCRLNLYFSESASLKAKRQRLRRIVERVRAKFNVAVAEVGQQDTWQRSSVGISVVGNAEDHVDAMLDRILSFVEQLYLGEILAVEREILHYSEDERLDGFDGLDGLDGFERNAAGVARGSAPWEDEETRR
ncbi:MAG: DUF503 domain-containing protein [Deltaproteobacteria bacterium]|nr:DUF503 domain-containing protein [Deltaproteobacteria bacterium]